MLLNVLASELKWYPTLFDTPLNATRAVFFWLTLALVCAFTVALLLTKNRAKLLKISLFGFTAYGCIVGATLLTLTVQEDGITQALFTPLLVLILTVGASAILLYIRHTKPFLILSGCLVGGALVAVLVRMGIYYGNHFQNDGYYNSDTASVNQLVLYASAILLVALVIGLGFLFAPDKKSKLDSKSIAYAAICIAMSFALSYLRLFKLPQGGSVTLASLLPLMIYSCLFGTKKGVFAGFIYGLLQAIQDPWIIHPAQFILDYPVAFAYIGLAGMFQTVKPLKKFPPLQFGLGAIIASAFRFLSHVLSGVFAFSAYAEGQNPWVYSLGYNSFVFVDIAIVVTVGVFVFSSKAFLDQTKKLQTAK